MFKYKWHKSEKKNHHKPKRKIFLQLQFYCKATMKFKSPASLILQNKELVQSFCLFFELKNADTMFCIRYFSKNWGEMAKKNTGQCLPTESKVAYKNSGNSGKNWKIETNPNMRRTCFSSSIIYYQFVPLPTTLENHQLSYKMNS